LNAREKFRKRLKLWADGIWMHDLKWLWMLCAALLPILFAKFFPVVKEEELHCADSFLKNPDILLLDEPTNHLDAETVAWLEHHLQKYEGTIIAVTHDRYFLDNVAGWILELDRGEGIPWKGNYSSWLEQKQERLRVEEKQESQRQKTLQRELEWIRMSPKARHAKSKSRITAYDKLLKDERKKGRKNLSFIFLLLKDLEM
jgi:ATPase subunit of ABC transporter with duplicated ATPase domains